jgi:hypothetical protein
MTINLATAISPQRNLRAVQPTLMTDNPHPQITVIVNNSDDQDHWSGLRRDKLVQAAMNHKAA